MASIIMMVKATAPSWNKQFGRPTMPTPTMVERIVRTAPKMVRECS